MKNGGYMLIPKKVGRSVVFLATFGLVLLGSPKASAGTYSNIQIVGVWSAPILTGNLIDTSGQFLPASDNTATAVSSISANGDTLQWGSGPTPPPPNASTVSFAGDFFASLPLNVANQKLGTLTYSNGTSTDPTVIFGATLTIYGYMGGVPDLAITPLPVLLSIFTTENSGACDTCDADFLAFPPPVSLNKTARIFEGTSAQFDLFGTFNGDPTIQITDIELTPGQTGGFIGPAAIPEPGTVILVSLALAILGFIRLRGRSHTQKGTVR